MTEINYCSHLVPAWERDPEGRKNIRKLKGSLEEFKKVLQNAHAAILEHTDPVYFERQKQLFAGSVSAIEHIETLIKFAENGCIATPEGWQVPPKPVESPDAEQN